MKKIFALILCSAIAISSVGLALPTTHEVHAAAASISAKPANAEVYIDGEKLNIQGYNIQGNNFFKLRDLAYALNGTSKQFSVEWNAKSNLIELQLEKPYDPIGNELAISRVKNSPAFLSRAEIIINNKKQSLKAYTIQGNTYFMLRELGEHLKFPVLWRPSDKSIHTFSAAQLVVEQYSDLFVLRGTDDYAYGNYRSLTRRHLFESDSGMWILEEPYQSTHHDSKMTSHGFLNVYAVKGVKTSNRVTTIKKELPLFGGFHVGDDGNYYIVFGQENMEEFKTKPVYRVVKYDQNWNKLAHTDLSDVYVTRPFHAGNLSMDSGNGQLVIHSTRQRYLSPDDGLHHQSNITFVLDMNTMQVIRNGEVWPSNHVSHSFATYVRKDGDHTIYADHGDAYPRSHILHVEQDGKGIIDRVDFAPPLGGKTGDNYTGIYLGGLEVGQNHYITVSTYSKEYNSQVNSQNVRLDYFSKKSEHDPYTATVWLTDYKAKDNIRIKQSHLVKINNSIFVALWTEEKYSGYQSDSSLYYAIVSDTGKILQKPTHLKGIPSPGNMSPLVKGNTIVWYYAKETGFKTDKDPVEIYTLTIPSYSEQELQGNHEVDPKSARSLLKVKQKIEQLGFQWEAYHETDKNQLAINNSKGLPYFNYIYYSDRDGYHVADSGKVIRGQFQYFFSNSSSTMEEQLALSKVIIETDLNVSLPNFVEQVSTLLKEKSKLFTDQLGSLKYSLDIDGITLNIYHYGTAKSYGQAYIEYTN